MADETGFLEWAFKGLVGVVVGTVVYMTKSLHSDIEKLKERQSSQGNDLRDHKLDSEKRYAKEDTLQHTLARMHERIDRVYEGIDDIKTLLIKKQ